MNLQLTPDQARAQLAGLQKQKDVVDRSIKMLAEAGQRLVDDGPRKETGGATSLLLLDAISLVAQSLADIIAVQLLQLGLQQEAIGANITALKGALNSSGIVLPSMLPPKMGSA